MLTINGIGRLGQEPKMQYTPAGTALTNLTVAADVGFGDKRETVWLRLSSFGNQAEALNKYLSKGSRLAFVAEVTKVGTYEKRDGTAGVNFDAKILSFSFLDKAEGGSVEREPEEF